MKLLASTLILIALAATVCAHDYLPGPKQTAPILLKGGTLFTISDGVKENTDMLLDKGRIAAIGKNLAAPDGAEIIDVTGRHVYPGLIAAGTSIGLTEIGAVRATRDSREVGSINPDVQATMAFNPDTEIIPSVRATGIAYAQIVPDGGLMRGRSGLLNMDGWTREDAAVKEIVGLHLTWPATGINTAWWESRTPEEQKKDMAKNSKRLRQLFADAEAYKLAKEADPDIDIDSRWEAMLPALNGSMSLFVHANDYRQIEQALAFAKEKKLKIVIVGGREAWKITERLVTQAVPVIYGSAHGLPMRADDAYDLAFKIPRLLHEAGVKFCLASFSYTGVRNLPFDAGQAVAAGLDKATALRSLTLSVAEIMGVENEIGSLEVGKKATVIISDGDIMDHLTHQVTHMFIDGRVVDLNNKHKELYRKYQAKSLN